MNKLLIFILSLVIALFMNVALQPKVYAADARNFNAGRIIEDNVFTDSNSMSVQSIQQFLDSKVSCDTWGVKISELGGGTRAQWMATRGISPPFRCVTDYRENISTGQNNYGKTDTPAGAIGAAEIIYNYSRQFNINPQVIIATLQKENSMITDEWPTPKQYSEAMGFGCPDNVAPGAPACDPQYGSFAAQVYQAARHFRGYIDNKPGWWIPFNTGWNSIAWSPNSSCGRSDVYIENRATVALYSYTPYQPNQAAKNAQYGRGDGCSAYGNRNFYLFFTDWFSGQYSYTAEKEAITNRYSIISGVLGSLMGNVYCYTSNGDRWCVQRYENGYILSGKYGAWESYGSIRDRWEALDFERGVLGYPRDEVYCYTKSNDRWCVQRYEKGYIISGKYGTWESYGDIRNRWASLGYENGTLGYPKEGVYCYTSNGDRWCVQRYENGYILSGKYGAWESYGSIRDRWEALDFERGVLGYPRDEVYCYTKSNDRWCVQRYEKGYIISGKYGTWESYGDIRNRWASLGYENGTLGYPTGAVIKDNNILSQKFEGGSINFNTSTKIFSVSGL